MEPSSPPNIPSKVQVTKALEGRRRVLGDDHPHTLGSWSNLIKLYEAWGKPCTRAVRGKPEKAKQWQAKRPPEEAAKE